MMKRMIALMMALVLCLCLFAGCGEQADSVTDSADVPAATIDYAVGFGKYDPNTVVMTVDGVEVTWSEFFYMLYSSLTQIEYYLGEIRWEDECVGGLTVEEYTMDMTLTMLKQLHAVERKAAELGVKLSKEDLQLIADNKANVMSQYCGENATEEDLEAFLLSELYLTSDVFTFINENSMLYEKLFTETIGEAGEKITDAEIEAFIESVPYVTAKHILIMTVDPTTGESLSEDKIAEAKQTAEDLLAQLNTIESTDKKIKKFDELMNTYSEDTGLSIFPDGYTFTYNEMYPVFEEAAFALNEYEISGIVESEAGYHILMRVPTTKDSAVNLEYAEDGSYIYYSVLAYAATEVYSQRLSNWMSECEVVWSEEFKDITAESIFA